MYASKEQQGKVTIVHAGKHQSADDYIKKVVEAEHGKDLLLVSSDNELCSYAQNLGIASIDALAFFGLLYEKKQAVTTARTMDKLQRSAYAPRHKELDAIMEEESKRIQLKQEEEVPVRVRGNSLKKHEKVLLKKIKKL